MILLYLKICIALSNLIQPLFPQEPALIVVPVADLVGEPYKNDHDYWKLPICGLPQPSTNCLRLHQALFNERVLVIEEKKHQVYIEIPNLYYIRHDAKQPQKRYWTHKKNVATLASLERKKADLSKVPPALTTHERTILPDATIASLMHPWHDALNKQTYSAGTRFVRAPEHDTQTSYAVYVIEPQTGNFHEGLVSKERAFIHDKPLSGLQQRQAFVQLLKAWAYDSTGSIPYVWGGASFTQCALEPFASSENNAFYLYPDLPQPIKTGFDCSGLISRAAQIVGIPYYYKNTATLNARLEPLKKNQKLQVGDLIWVPGHVMVVSDIKNNLVIEARSYNHGYGKVQEVPLQTIFKNIASYKKLVEHFHNKKPIQRLNSQGEVMETFKTFNILSLDPLLAKK